MDLDTVKIDRTDLVAGIVNAIETFLDATVSSDDAALVCEDLVDEITTLKNAYEVDTIRTLIPDDEDDLPGQMSINDYVVAQLDDEGGYDAPESVDTLPARPVLDKAAERKAQRAAFQARLKKQQEAAEKKG